MPYSPRPSLPVEVLTWLTGRLSYLLPPGRRVGEGPRRWRGLLYRVRAVYRATAALISLGRWLHRIPA